jgi:hypothetical protein
MSDAETIANLIGQHVGCAGLAGSAWTACMRNVDAGSLVPLNNGLIVANRSAWAPVEDGVEFTASTQVLWSKGALNAVDGILMGTVEDEGTEFVFMPSDASMSQFEAYMNNSVDGEPFRSQVKVRRVENILMLWREANPILKSDSSCASVISIQRTHFIAHFLFNLRRCTRCRRLASRLLLWSAW